MTSLMLALVSLAAQDWSPAKGPLATRWAKDVSPGNALPDYPRPQMTRKDWLNLNGLWDYAIAPSDGERPAAFDGRILVPYPIESALSGVMKRVGKDQRLWYRRAFEVPRGWRGRRVLLHFGAVDWETTVWVNGQKLGDHRGGYDPFSFDITAALKGSGPQEIVLCVGDPTDAGTQPRGKQVAKPHGIWYTPTTGIWQTVWIEPVAEGGIESIRIVPDVDRGLVRVTVQAGSEAAELLALDAGRPVGRARGKPGEPIEVAIDAPKLWSPETPHLYALSVAVSRGATVVDRVESYFGLRKISLAKDEAGVLRLSLNNKPYFQYGLLDQGFWPDGIYTAPTDEALRYDIEATRRLGFNMARKHVKVEPDRWYYWCDVLGLLVWQDMPSGDKFIGGKDPDVERTPASADQYKREFGAVIDALGNHPSIVMWVPFNEGWGQFDTAGITEWVRTKDPSRLVNPTSGWTDRGVGDVRDIHAYPGPAAPPNEPARAAVLGEFGGLGLPLSGHTWQSEKNWGYKSFTTREALMEAYVGLLRRLEPLIGGGLSAAVYTQTTDVEIEVNGLLTYDRALIKMDVERVEAAARRLYRRPPAVQTVVPTSQEAPQEWRYTTEAPAAGWEKPAFDDAGWPRGPGGFGRKETPGAVVRTAWESSDIWIRRTFELSGPASELYLKIHHDEDAEVYLNGRLVARLTGYTTAYVLEPLSEEASAALRPGRNVLAIHCRQTTGGQYIDAGLTALRER
jgi:hypothetical protein